MAELTADGLGLGFCFDGFRKLASPANGNDRPASRSLTSESLADTGLVSAEPSDAGADSTNQSAKRSRLRQLTVRLWSSLGMDGQDAFRKLVSMMAITVVMQVAALLGLYLVVKTLTVAEFGILSSALAVQGFGTILSTLGIRPILVRELSRHPERRDELCSAYTVIALCGGSIVAAIVFAVLTVLSLQMQETFVFQIVAVGTILAAINPAPIYDADGKQVVSTALSCSAELFAFVCVLGLWANGLLGVVQVACVFAVKWFAMSAFGWGYLFFRRRGFRWHLDRAGLRPLLRSSTPLSAAAMLQTAMISSGPLLARTLGGQTAAGIYGLAHQALTAHMLIMGLAGRVVAPRVAVRYQDRGFVIRAGVAYVGVACCVSVAGAALGLIVLGFGLQSAYDSARWPLAVLMIAAAIRSVGVYFNLLHVARAHEKTVLGSLAVSALAYAASYSLIANANSDRLQVPEMLALAIAGSLLVGAAASALLQRAR